MRRNTKKNHPRRLHWSVLWGIQAAAMLILSIMIAFSYWLGGTLHAILVWSVLPAAGMVSAYLTTKHGLLNYAAWIAPPAAGAFGHLLVWNYMPSAGPIMLCAFTSLIGAAAGEVIKQQNKNAD